MDNNMDNMIGRRLDGRYELLELIGTGGMADIYKARDITEDRIVAVKILKNEFAGSEDFLRRFRNESKAIALLSHPNIVKIYDVGFNEQIQFIVMEYIDGISLAEYIKLQGVLKWKDAVYFTIQILRALQHAHDRGIVHRDIKSQNVMMLPDGTIKVMDFGIARFNRETDKTLSEKAIGSVHYISPEQARGEMTDEKSDIYSVGVMLYEMLTGQKPFDGETPVAIALQHMQTPPKPPREINSSIPEGLEEITLKAMQKEPSMRYQTAGEMINDIEEFKKDPSIVFEYKYFSADGSTKYFDKVSDPNAPEQNAANDTLSESEEEEDNDLYDDDEDDEEVEERRSPLLPILFAVASVFVIMTAWLIFSIVTKNLGTTSGTTDEMTMPNIIGMTLDDVKEKYPDLNLDIDRQYSTDYKENEVMDQKTPAGRTIKKSTIVNIVISNGPQKVEVDDYANLSAQDAQIKLEKKGLKPKLVYINDDEVAKDIVIKTEPAAHSEVSQGTVVKVYVSNGKLVKAVNDPAAHLAGQISILNLANIQRSIPKQSRTVRLHRTYMVGVLMGDEDVPDGMWVDTEPAHFLRQTVIVVSGINHNGGIALAVEEDICHPLPHTSDIFIDPAGVQRLEDLLAPVHPAHCFSLKFRCFFRHDRTSFLCCDAKPALFIFVALDLTKSCFFQILFQCSIRIDGHAIDDLRPFVVFCRFAVCFVTDEKDSAGLQHPINLSEILRKFRPEIDRFKGGHHIKLLRFKRQFCHTCLLHGTPSCRNGSGIDFSRLFHADG